MTEAPGSALPWDPLELAAAARRTLAPQAVDYFEASAVFPTTHENEAAWARRRFAFRPFARRTYRL